MHQIKRSVLVLFTLIWTELLICMHGHGQLGDSLGLSQFSIFDLYIYVYVVDVMTTLLSTLSVCMYSFFFSFDVCFGCLFGGLWLRVNINVRDEFY